MAMQQALDKAKAVTISTKAKFHNEALKEKIHYIQRKFGPILYEAWDKGDNAEVKKQFELCQQQIRDVMVTVDKNAADIEKYSAPTTTTTTNKTATPAPASMETQHHEEPSKLMRIDSVQSEIEEVDDSNTHQQ